MVNVVGSKDDYRRWKPPTMRHYKTMSELCDEVGRSISRIKQLEKAGAIPAPVRVKVGELNVRLYSPKEVAKIKKHFERARPGRRPA